jgi:hypothetical protein
LVISKRRRVDVLLGKSLGTGAHVEAHLRQQNALALPHLGFGRAAVGGSLAHPRIGCDRLIDGVDDGEAFARRGDPAGRTAAGNNHQRNQTHSRTPSPTSRPSIGNKLSAFPQPAYEKRTMRQRFKCNLLPK